MKVHSTSLDLFEPLDNQSVVRYPWPKSYPFAGLDVTYAKLKMNPDTFVGNVRVSYEVIYGVMGYVWRRQLYRKFTYPLYDVCICTIHIRQLPLITPSLLMEAKRI